mmetsp:Transcript_31866/g.46892  ORF Transcript_31866/g.46892 Transcript_31866/m.46892 type:complete len:389 (-) Transcript_31866:15-1181(-)
MKKSDAIMYVLSFVIGFLYSILIVDNGYSNSCFSPVTAVSSSSTIFLHGTLPTPLLMTFPSFAKTIAMPSSFTLSPPCFTASSISSLIYSAHPSPTISATYGCVSYAGLSAKPPEGLTCCSPSSEISKGTTSKLRTANSIFKKLAPNKASRIAFLLPATIIICCLAPDWSASTVAVCISPPSETRTLRVRRERRSSLSRIAFVILRCTFFLSSFFSTLSLSSFPLSISNLARTAKAIAAPKSIPRLRYSALRSTSSLAPLRNAATPERVINPPRKAPNPNDAYKNNRNVLHGAMDSERSFDLNPGSTAAFPFPFVPAASSMVSDSLLLLLRVNAAFFRASVFKGETKVVAVKDLVPKFAGDTEKAEVIAMFDSSRRTPPLRRIILFII